MSQRFSSFCLALSLVLVCSAASAAEAPKKATHGGKKRAAAVSRTQAGRVYTSLLPADGGLINNARPTISAEYLDEGIGINPADTKLYVDGVDVTSQAQATATKVTYTPAQPLADGLHKVKLDIDDKAGNPASATWSFTIRTQAPKIKITSHKPNQYVNQSPILITGTVDDPRARVVVNGIAAAVDRGTFSAKVSIVEGSNTITAIATDMFSNTGTDSVVVVLESQPPTVEITSPLPNGLISSSTVTITGSVDAKAASVTVTTQHAAGAPVKAELASGTFSAGGVKLVEGMNTITAKAVSRAGNVGTAAIKVTVDTIPPHVAITSPKNQTATNKKMIAVSGTVDDPTAMVKVNNTPVQVSRGAFTLSGVNLNEGSNIILVEAVDRAGNQAKPATVTVVLKTVPPAPPRIHDLPFVTRESVLVVSGAAEAGSQVELFMNSVSKGVVKADEKGAFAVKVTLQQGNNAFSAVATDAVGNVSASSAIVNVFQDTTAPRIL